MEPVVKYANLKSHIKQEQFSLVKGPKYLKITVSLFFFFFSLILRVKINLDNCLKHWKGVGLDCLLNFTDLG